MKRSLRYFLLSVVSVFLLIGLFLHNKRRSSNLPSSSLGRRPPKITIIAIWSILGPSPVHLSYFFQSVEANEQIDLLFVQLDKHGSGCSSYSNAPNVQELCLSEDQYHQLHVNFLCRRWRCSEDEKRLLFETIKKNGESDSNNSYFRILRAGVFSAFINPVTTIWGWCDMDEYWGNFTRTFPSDIAPEYDIIVASSQPEFANHRLLFMRGHMSFFRNSSEVLDRLHSFPKFASLSAYMSMPPTLVDAEESEFSQKVFSDETTFTFLVFEGMLNNYDTALLSPRGVFYTPMRRKDLKDPDRRERFAALVRPVHQKPRRPTFSDQGIEEEAHVYYDGYQYPGDVWFDRKHVTFVETGWLEPEKREQKAYFMRHEPYGPIMQRLEPRERHLSHDRDLVVDECLYKHWQTEKRESWFRRIPRVLGAGKIFVQHNNAQGDIWNEHGDVIYSTGL